MTPAVAVITGAGSGLGRALAKAYAADGYAIVAADIQLDRAVETLALLTGTNHAALHCDIACDASMRALADAVFARYGEVDVLINNAGVASGGSMLDSTFDEWRWMIDLNLLGVVRGVKAFLPKMVARGRGRIINIASIAGLASAPGMMSYGVAKAAVVALTDQLRAEIAPRGLSAHVACPHFFRTNLIENFKGDPRFAAVATKMMERARESAGDIADAIKRASDAGTFLIIPTARERAMWRVKRWFPNYYFRQLLARVAAHERGS